MGNARKHIVVLTGAGVSAESGISTFRDNGGLWDKFDPQVVASIDGWRKDKALLLDFYNIRRKELAGVKPNAAHLAIASRSRCVHRASHKGWHRRYGKWWVWFLFKPNFRCVPTSSNSLRKPTAKPVLLLRRHILRNHNASPLLRYRRLLHAQWRASDKSGQRQAVQL